MARIPDAEIDRLRNSVNLVRLIEADGHTLKRTGKDWACACPFHDGDNEPSLIVSPDKNLFHCFACGAAGSPIDWLMKRRGLAFRRAVEVLRAELGETAGDVPSTSARVIAPLPADADDAALLAEVVELYHQTLRTDAAVQAYLAKRGLDHPEVIDVFKLGYANRTLAYRLPEKQLKAGAAVRGQLQRLGVLRASGHEHLAGSLVVPVFDAAGNVAELYGRKLSDQQREGTPLHLYLPGPHRGVFNLTGIRGSNEVILCEALLDALTFWCAGYRHVTSAFGVGGFTDELLQALIENSTQRVLIAYDRDEAGERAAEALAPKLAAQGIAAYRVQFPKSLDANAYALKVGPAAKSLGLVLQQAVPMGTAKALPVHVAVERPVKVQDAPAPVAAPALAEVSPLVAAVALPAPVAEVLASSTSPSPSDGPAIEVSEQQAVIVLGDRRYRVRGLAKNLSADTLKVNVLAVRGEQMHIDTLDLYAAKARQVFVKQSASALDTEESVIERDLAKLLLALEGLQEQAIRAAVTPKKAEASVSPEQQDRALALLRDPRLVERIVSDVGAIGVVGEDANALVGYLACVSRKLDKPLAILIQSTSAAGKSTLMDALLSLMPEHERVHYSAMTGQSLFYLGEGDLRHSILAIAEEEGVRQAAYALKLLQSQGELTIASTGKDPTTGKLVTEEYRVEGPVMLFLTTTAIDLDEELLNRCLVLTINETREQTEAIHRRQREARTLAGLVASKQGAAIRALHQAAQSLLKPLAVVNPYAEALTFRSESTRMRRDHAKYLTLIDAIAFLHQYQRPVKTATVAGKVVEYVEVTLDDIALANRLAHEVLGRSLDELPPQTRRLLGMIVAMVGARCAAQRIERRDLRFTRADVRAVAGLSETQLRLHLERLVDLDYLLVHRGQRGQSFVYELQFDGTAEDAVPRVMGLVDVDVLRSTDTTPSSRGTAVSSRGSGPEFAGSSRPHRGGFAAGSRGEETPRNATPDADISSLAAAVEETALPGTPRRTATQRKPNGAHPTP
ncbi:CHC2 zinc finger domain-containing protein [Pseudomarimonas arenosa]|uniref:Toprim domain-containing protein n=1 Tax=Pseudomarimonas arenosa TaxID=2774145 RepID=A0AAW3ZV74_9GAMM|nr:CHC2 zinc finger domain-containing protein [Pseudomarimonas arenosa]MBD8528202.1 toprim domain-containing protein [Pseudomarimonas arenosa]